jgi:hypothetical protein
MHQQRGLDAAMPERRSFSTMGLFQVLLNIETKSMLDIDFEH